MIRCLCCRKEAVREPQYETHSRRRWYACPDAPRYTTTLFSRRIALSLCRVVR